MFSRREARCSRGENQCSHVRVHILGACRIHEEGKYQVCSDTKLMNERDDEIVIDVYVATIVMVENTTQDNYTMYMISSL
jgi:hypothetical protein